jgi:flavin reductase (DIM6/NTAB) family NADH-FMN oxidoreductase RutF
VLFELEATPRIELGMEVLQTSALPLGYVAAPYSESDSTRGHRRALPLAPMPGQAFRDAMARLPAGVVLISTRAADGYKGMTASSFVSISLEPPMVLVAMDKDSATRVAVLDTRAFNISVLARHQEFVADQFAGRAPAVDPRWRTLPHRLGKNGIPLLDGAAAWLECRLAQVHTAGDHDICVGEVEEAELGAGEPLILWDRRFWSLY